MDTEIEEVKQEIKKVEKQIENVEKQIENVEENLTKAASEAHLNYLRKKKEQLRKKEEQLRKEKEQLRKKEKLLEKEEKLREEELLRKAGTSGLSSVFPEKLLQDLGDFLAKRKAEDNLKTSVCLSSVSRSIWDTLERRVGLNVVYQDFVPKSKRLSDLPAFGWDDRLDKAQADGYIAHLNKIVRGRKWELIDAANDYPTLLSGSFGGWNFKGTTDVAFVHRRVARSDARRGLRCIFELKKDCRLKEYGGRGGLEKATIQTLICLVMANVFAQQYRPHAVLTDLGEFWSIYWMDGSTIYWYTFESRAEAVGYIEELLQDSDDNEMGTSEALAGCARPDGDDEGLLFIKRRKMYDPPGMDNLNDLVGLIPDEEILNARAQLAVQHLQKSLQIPLFSGEPDVGEPEDNAPCVSHMYV